ncbi:MAG: hypothetical protein K6G22_06450 [Lachnospiraceae bacterium]|nr:hypothetical protein [Lachnospiraceae bacterium]
MMKQIMIIMIAAILGVIFMGCYTNVPTPSNPENGGLTDNSDNNVSKEIKSDELVSFYLKTEADDYVRIDPQTGEGSPVIYPYGMYTFEMKEEDDKAVVKAVFADADDHRFIDEEMTGEYEFTTDKKALKELDSLMKEHNVPYYNGHAKRNSALGTYIDLDASYASGETLSVYAEGGYSARPTGWDDGFFIAFFDELVKENTGKAYCEDLVEDNSDPEAVKEFSSDQIREIYAELTPDYDHSSVNDEIPYKRYRIQYRSDGLTFYEGVETNCALWTDDFLSEQFDVSDEDIKDIQKWIEDRGLLKYNGWDKKSRISSRMKCTLHVYYESGESLSIDGYGQDAIPAEWDPIEFLSMFRDIAREQGVELFPARD